MHFCLKTEENITYFHLITVKFGYTLWKPSFNLLEILHYLFLLIFHQLAFSARASPSYISPLTFQSCHQFFAFTQTKLSVSRIYALFLFALCTSKDYNACTSEHKKNTKYETHILVICMVPCQFSFIFQQIVQWQVVNFAHLLEFLHLLPYTDVLFDGDHFGGIYRYIQVTHGIIIIVCCKLSVFIFSQQHACTSLHVLTLPDNSWRTMALNSPDLESTGSLGNSSA